MLTRSAIIVGGGIFGVSAAVELRRRGFDVSVFDPGPLPHPDAASTDISKVIRMDYGIDEFYMEMMEAAFPDWEEWNARWPQPLFHRTGVLFLSHHELTPGDFEYESFQRLEQRGYPVRRLKAQDIQQDYPAWNTSRYVDGYYSPLGGWAQSAAVVAQLVREASAAGARLYEGKTFAGLMEEGGRVNGIVTRDGERYTADFVIVAAGAWTPTLLPYLAPVMWATGQPVLHFQPQNPLDYRPPRFPVWATSLDASGWYGFPAVESGIVKVAHHGPGRRMDALSPRVVPPPEETRFRQFLQQSLPGLADAPLAGTRLCLYCDTFDGNFWIDHDPQREGLLVCAGDSGHAFKFAPLLGTIIADVLEHRSNPYAGRFAWRQPPASIARTSVGDEGSPTPRK